MLLSSYTARNSIIRKSSYSEDPSRHLDSSWIASRSIQSSGLDLDPKGHNSILLLSRYLVTRFFNHRVTYNSITYKLSYALTHNDKFTISIESVAIEMHIFDCSWHIWLESTISLANSSKILCSKTLLTVIFFKITHGGALISKFCSQFQTSLSM